MNRRLQKALWTRFLIGLGLFVLAHSASALLPFPYSANQRGTVTCLDKPAYSYDVYLPPAYNVNGPALPILYTMSPTGGGMVSSFQTVCSSLNIIVIGIIGSRNGMPWDQVLREMHAVSRDVRLRVLYDPTAEFAGGLSGGGECSYMFSRLRAQHVAGVLEMAGWLGRGNSGASVAYYCTDRVLTNLLVARTTGTTDTAAQFYNVFDSNYLATCSAVVNDWSFSGGHTTPPDSVKSACLSWLLSHRLSASPADAANASALAARWQASLAAGQHEAVLRECVSNLVSFPRSWYAYQAQLTLDQLMTNSIVFRSLNVANLACGNAASDLFYYYARSSATNADWPRYNSCLKALTGITATNGFAGTLYLTGITVPVVIPTSNGSISITFIDNDRAGDIYGLLTTYQHYPSPVLQCSPVDAGWMNLWASEDTAGLGYSLQFRTNLVDDAWQDVPALANDTKTLWSAGLYLPPEAPAGYFRLRAVPVPATSPPWPPQ